MPSEQAHAVAEAIGQLKEQFEYAEVRGSGDERTFVTLLRIGETLYPLRIDYDTYDRVSSGELISNETFSSMVDRFDYDADPVPQSVIATTKQIRDKHQENDE